jgi:hypothetical protein
VSDSQEVRSHAVRPILVDAVKALRPTLAPCKVRLDEPVTAEFVRRIRLTPLKSVEKPDVRLPFLLPMVSTDRRLPPVMCCDWHLTDVSAPHAVRSQAVWPILAIAECDVSPMLAPCRVTLAPPVVAVFVRRVMLTSPAVIEKLFVTLPDRAPLVIATRRVLAVPCADWQRVDVSDIQVVPSTAEPPILMEPQYDASPIDDPSKVMLPEPVAAWLVRNTADTDATSAEIAWLELRKRAPDDKSTLRVPCKLCATWHRSDVSDSHDDRSLAVCPMAIASV